MSVIRPSQKEDVRRITQIYSFYVLETIYTLETVPPTEDEMAQRRSDVLSKNLPYLVMEQSGTIIGYAYCNWFKPRAGYRYSVELSIFLDRDWCGKGYGHRLLHSLIQEAEAVGVRKMIAVISDSRNQRSIGLHAAVGFSHVGTFKSCGWKFGQWLDVLLMEKDIGEGHETSPKS